MPTAWVSFLYQHLFCLYLFYLFFIFIYFLFFSPFYNFVLIFIVTAAPGVKGGKAGHYCVLCKTNVGTADEVNKAISDYLYFTGHFIFPSCSSNVISDRIATICKMMIKKFKWHVACIKFNSH